MKRTWRGLRYGVAVLAVSGVWSACDAVGTLGAEVTQMVASVSVSPATPSVGLGRTVQLAATAQDANNTIVSGATFRWSSSNPGVAAVDSSGLVSAVAAGTTTITATSEGKSAAAAVTVTDPSAVTFLASHGFEDGTSGPYGYPWTQFPEDMKVVDDPTGKRGGKVLQAHYPRTSTTEGWDVNRGVFYNFPNEGQAHGETTFFRGYVYMPTPAAGLSGDDTMRKLLYYQDFQTRGPGMTVKAHGQALTVEGTGVSRVDVHGAFSWDTWHLLEVEIAMNSSPTTADGRVRVWLDGRLLIERLGVNINNVDGYRYRSVGIGYQLQKNDSSQLYDEYRYWDDVALAKARIGP